MKKYVCFLILLCITASCASTKKAADRTSGDIVRSDTRDGSSYEKAIIIDKTDAFNGVGAEYEWLRQNYPGYKFNGQFLAEKNKVPYDIIRIITADGQSKDIFFDISRFFGKD